ncbi:MAG TPA: hypothetical protein VMF32_22470 [Xanthobacteraceae bacterium]|nr:hypothetical protein [Xanthobacteraceae bacterium]
MATLAPTTGQSLAKVIAIAIGCIIPVPPGRAAVGPVTPGPSPTINVAASRGPAGSATVEGKSAHRWHDMAEKLYVATSRDAQTFGAALLIPEVRQKIEKVLGPLSDFKLKELAAQSNAEALYWYKYMQGLEHH